jgi:hypothetical protein
MAHRNEPKKLKSVAKLVAWNDAGEIVTERKIPLDKYYENPDDLIDSGEYRKEQGIVRVKGTLHDAKGAVIQEFENSYSIANGSYLHGKIRHADGTITED